MHLSRKPLRTSTLALVLLAGGWSALAFGPAAAADDAEPGVNPVLDACQRYATQSLEQAEPQRFGSLKLLADDLDEVRQEAKAGSQFVSIVLSGRGVRQDKGGTPTNVRFTCLLESAARPLFIATTADGPRDPVALCWDAFEPAGWGPLGQCLQDALKRAERALATALAAEVDQAAQSLDRASAKQTLHKSNAAWAKYRDAECARRMARVAGRNHPDVGELTCRIHQTAERISDLRSDD